MSSEDLDSKNNNCNVLDEQQSYSITALRCTCCLQSLIKNDKMEINTCDITITLSYLIPHYVKAVSFFPEQHTKERLAFFFYTSPEEQISQETELHPPKAICVPKVFKNAQPEEPSLTFDCTVCS